MKKTEQNIKQYQLGKLKKQVSYKKNSLQDDTLPFSNTLSQKISQHKSKLERIESYDHKKLKPYKSTLIFNQPNIKQFTSPTNGQPINLDDSYTIPIPIKKIKLDHPSNDTQKPKQMDESKIQSIQRQTKEKVDSKMNDSIKGKTSNFNNNKKKCEESELLKNEKDNGQKAKIMKINHFLKRNGEIYFEVSLGKSDEFLYRQVKLVKFDDLRKQNKWLLFDYLLKVCKSSEE